MLLISQQEAEHGTNMYDSMVPADEAAIMELMDTGRFSHEQAVQALFEKRYNSRPGGIAIQSPSRYPQQQQQQYHQPVNQNEFSYLPPPPPAGHNNNNWQNMSYNSNYSSQSSMMTGNNFNNRGPPPAVSARPIQRIQSIRDSSTSGSPTRNPQFFSADVTKQTPPPLDPHMNVSPCVIIAVTSL